MTRHDLRKPLTIAAGALALAFSGGAVAQGGYGQQGQQGQQGDGYQSPPPQQQQAPSADSFSDEDLQAFAEAQQEVSAISKDFRQELKSAEDSSERMEIQKSANQEMIEAVRAAGLDPATYNEIGKAVQANPSLEKKVENMQ